MLYSADIKQAMLYLVAPTF